MNFPKHEWKLNFLCALFCGGTLLAASTMRRICISDSCKQHKNALWQRTGKESQKDFSSAVLSSVESPYHNVIRIRLKNNNGAAWCTQGSKMVVWLNCCSVASSYEMSGWYYYCMYLTCTCGASCTGTYSIKVEFSRVHSWHLDWRNCKRKWKEQNKSLPWLFGQVPRL